MLWSYALKWSRDVEVHCVECQELVLNFFSIYSLHTFLFKTFFPYYSFIINASLWFYLLIVPFSLALSISHCYSLLFLSVTHSLLFILSPHCSIADSYLSVINIYQIPVYTFKIIYMYIILYEYEYNYFSSILIF